MFAPHAIPGVEPGEHHDVGADEALIVAVQIESRSGVENCEKIAQVDGLDVLFIGECTLFLFRSEFRSPSRGFRNGNDRHLPR